MFSKRLKELREEKDLTQAQLGKLVNLAQQTIGHYEVGRAKPDFETIQEAPGSIPGSPTKKKQRKPRNHQRLRGFFYALSIAEISVRK